MSIFSTLKVSLKGVMYGLLLWLLLFQIGCGTAEKQKDARTPSGAVEDSQEKNQPGLYELRGYMYPPDS